MEEAGCEIQRKTRLYAAVPGTLRQLYRAILRWYKRYFPEIIEKFIAVIPGNGEFTGEICKTMDGAGGLKHVKLRVYG